MESADIAAIVLGVLLLVLAISTFVICFLYYKGYLGRDTETKVMPEGIGHSPERLRQFTDAAIEKSYKQSRKSRGREYNQKPIIYLDEDIYHPPNSRPLPDNGVYAEPYPENIISTIKIPHKHSHIEKMVPNGHHSKHHAEEMFRETEGEEFSVPQNGGLNIRTHFGYESPYMDPRDLAYYH